MPLQISLSLSLFNNEGCFCGLDKCWNRDGDVEREGKFSTVSRLVPFALIHINSFLPRPSDRLIAGSACRNFKVGEILLRFRSKNAAAARNASLIRPRRGNKTACNPGTEYPPFNPDISAAGPLFLLVSFDAFPEDR